MAVSGTTRDLVTDVINLDGLRVTLVDTAGLHATADRVEAESISQGQTRLRDCRLTLTVLDRSQALDGEDRGVVTNSR